MATENSADRLTTGDVLCRIKEKFGGEYAVLTEVGNATGAKQSRWADALVMCLWPSRGLELQGMEVKVSRTDWLKELREPGKAEAVCQFCDRWWIVAGDCDLVKLDELPRSWGLMVPQRHGLKVAKQAPLLKAKPMTREFLAAIFRRAAEQSVCQELLSKEFERGREQGSEQARRDQSYQLREFELLKEHVTTFQSASGVDIAERWQRPEKIGKAVRFVLEGGLKFQLSQVKDLLSLADRANRRLRPLRDELETMEDAVSAEKVET